jgi:PAS domain S-box-containing protein/diguanylate cyclase (GGDEF)-like protein
MTPLEAEAHLAAIVQASDDAVVSTDRRGRVTSWNAGAERMSGVPAAAVLGRPVGVVVPAAGAGQEHEILERVVTGQVTERLETSWRRPDGVVVRVELTFAPIGAASGVTGVSVVGRDVSARHAAERALRASSERLRLVVETSPDPFVAMDEHGCISGWNRASETTFGWAADEVIGRPLGATLIPERLRGGHEAGHRRVVATGHSALAGRPLELAALHRDGFELPVELTLVPVQVAGRPVFHAFMRDLRPRREAERVEREAQAERLRRAGTDELTGLPNRRRVRELGDEALAAGGGLAVALVDVARFHALNDALGRAAGDQVLRGVAAALGRALPDGAVVGRLEADCFALLLAGPAEEAVAALGDALAAAQAGSITVGDLALAVELVAGVATAPRDGDGAERLLTSAERALRAAKATRSGLERYDEARDGVDPASLPIVTELRDGLERGELVMHFQPQLDLATGRIAGAEALVRWQHPTRGLLAPGAFLPAVEQSGLMRRLTATGLDQALAACRRWLDAGIDMPVSVNLSVLNLLDMDIAHDVARLLARHGVPPGRLRLEITEDTLMADPERSGAVLAGIDAMGVALAIDDFGTGHSSLAYLQRLPVDELKVDRCFVAEMARGANAAIVRAAVELGHALGLRVVVEGVEDEATLAALTGLGADLAQGYLVGRPMPVDALLALVAGDPLPAGAP